MEIHASSLKKETIKAIRIAKDSVLKYKSILDISVTKQMISMVSTSRQLFMDYLEQKWKEEEKAKAKLNIDKNESEKRFAQKQNIELQNIESTLAQIQSGFKVTDESFSEGNAQLKALLLKKSCTRKELQKAQSKIEMSMKHRQELQKDEKKREEKRKKKSINEKKKANPKLYLRPCFRICVLLF